MATGVCGNGWPDGIKHCAKAVRISGVRIQGQQRPQNEMLLWRVERVGRCGWGEVVKMKNWQLFLILSAIYSMPHMYDVVSRVLALGFLMLAVVATILENE